LKLNKYAEGVRQFRLVLTLKAFANSAWS